MYINPVQKYRLASTNFADIQYYQNGYIGTDTNIHIGAPLVKDEYYLKFDHPRIPSRVFDKIFSSHQIGSVQAIAEPI